MTQVETRSLAPDLLKAEVASLSSPDVLKSPFGDLRFFDGVPLPDTVTRAYDALDLIRGISAFMNCVPGASLVAFRRGLRSIGISSPRVIGYSDPRANSTMLALTPNTETTYGTTWLDLKAWGPTVIEAPASSMCVVDDFWFRHVADMGIPGPDKGRGGKYLFLPPDYLGDVPDDYYVYRSPTYGNFLVLRALGGVVDMKKTRIYPLAEARSPKPNEWLNWIDLAANTIHANDFSFFEEVNELVQEEPVEALDAERAGQLLAIGIAKGKPFAPDARMRTILEQAARIGAGFSRVVSYAARDAQASYYGSWKQAFVGGSHAFLRNGARLLDARTQFHYIATVVTPAMTRTQAGAGSAYAYTVHDSKGDILDGDKTYRLHVNPNPPAKNFWSVDVYDTQTRSLIQVPSTIWPALASNAGRVRPNADGSFDLYFGPKAPAGRESNWVETLPGKSWFAIFRLYGPLEPWFNQTWRLNEFERVD
jgi:hypothetical protein